MHLAEINIGRLLAPTNDPKVAEFMANLDRVNGLGKRMPGFEWMMEGADGQGGFNSVGTRGGGKTGNGWVGESHSPAKAPCGTGRSSTQLTKLRWMPQKKRHKKRGKTR